MPKDLSKENIKKDILLIQKKYKNEFKDNVNNVTRDYYRSYGNYKETEINKLFGNFKNCIKECIEDNVKPTREFFDIKKEYTEINKRYFVSAIVAGMKVNEAFIESILNYCNKEKAELILLVMRGVKKDDAFSQDIVDKYGKYFHTEVDFNLNLKAMDFMLAPQQIISLTGLSRLTKKGLSLITAHTKQQLESVASKVGAFHHLMYSTGCVSLPNYSCDRIGRIAKQDHLNGGIIVEIENKNIFHIRNVVADNKDSFCDLGKLYSKDKVKTIECEIVLGDSHIGIEDSIAHNASKEMIDLLKPKKVYFNDAIDFHSINPHEEFDLFAQYERPKQQKSLDTELSYAGKFLEEFTKSYKKINFVILPSNHIDFLDRYLTSGLFVKDTAENAKLACELFSKHLDGYNCLKYYFDSRNFDLKNFSYPKREDSVTSWDYDVIHGDRGNNGSKGTIKSLDSCYSKNISGHSHSAGIFRNSIKVGTLSKLIQRYNKAGGSNWTMTNCISYSNKTAQLVHIIDGKWRIT